MGFLNFFNTTKKQSNTNSNSHLALERYATLNHLLSYKSIPIFHRNEREEIKFILFDSHRGLYLFDSVSWQMQEIKNATATLATPDKKSNSDVKVDNIHNFIKRKFNEVLHTEGCELCNVLIFENITKENFQLLDKSFHALMPKKNIIFADDTAEEIALKLNDILPILNTPLEAATLLGALFFQLKIMPDNLHKETALLTQEQYSFINNELDTFSTITGTYGSGKSSLILLKAIYELLAHPEYKIIIVMPTLAVCDLLKKQLLDIIEYAIIDIDLLSIHILSPQQLIAQHYQKLYKNESFNFAKITPKMFSHQYQSADIIFCDDSYLLDDEFVQYLIKQQAKKKLCLVSLEQNSESNNYHLTHSFRTPLAFLQLNNKYDKKNENENLHFLKGNAFMHIMIILRDTLKDVNHSKILIAVEHSQFAIKLIDEINSFYGDISFLYKADENLLNQDFGKILIATINELAHLQREYVILVKSDESESKYISHAIGRAAKSLHIINSEEDS
jgi:hypothetical protein